MYPSADHFSADRLLKIIFKPLRKIRECKKTPPTTARILPLFLRKSFRILRVYDPAVRRDHLYRTSSDVLICKKSRRENSSPLFGFTPETIRTSDLLLRRQLLYPAELPEHYLPAILWKCLYAVNRIKAAAVFFL